MNGSAARPLEPGTAPTPLAIGPANCEAMLGVSWRWLRDHAADLGLTIWRVDSKPFVDASEAFAAIRRHATTTTPAEPEQAPPKADDESIEALRAQLGMRRRCP